MLQNPHLYIIFFLQTCDYLKKQSNEICSDIRPPKSSTKPDPVLTDDEDEDDPELIEAKIVLRDVSNAGKFMLNLFTIQF